MHRPLTAALAAMLVVAALPAAHAHVTLETQQAQAPSTYKAVLRVGHGCDGSPTVKLRVQIPAGVIAVKPTPKPGWKLQTIKAPYGKSFDYYGTPLSEGVREIVWSGKLLDEHYDEFVFRAYLTEDLKPGQTLYFPVVQECARGAHQWTDTSGDPHAGHHGGPGAAPGVKFQPKP